MSIVKVVWKRCDDRIEIEKKYNSELKLDNAYRRRENAGLIGRVVTVNIEEQMKSAYIDYSMSGSSYPERCPMSVMD